MSDPRSAPPKDLIVMAEAARIAEPVVDLTRGAGGPRDRQLLYGDPVTVLNRTDTHCLIRSEKDGYCGYVAAPSVAAPATATHKVTARATHAYHEATIKSPDLTTLSFGSRLAALSETATFIETDLGFIPRQHVHPVDTFATDPAVVAQLFLGTAYLWGGNSFKGIDCSGLVQAAFLACGLACPGDSDQQALDLGKALPDDARVERNDLIFWKGHVALVADSATLIHANAGHMATVSEPIDVALARIEAQGDGLPTGRRRPALR
ncbi:MAG: NlpC/P60 family protein [Pseudomonadota bacterium]